MSNKPIGEFTPSMIARHNATPSGNSRKVSGVDRGKYENHCPPVPGQGEYDSVVVVKQSGNE